MPRETEPTHNETENRRKLSSVHRKILIMLGVGVLFSCMLPSILGITPLNKFTGGFIFDFGGNPKNYTILVDVVGPCRPDIVGDPVQRIFLSGAYYSRENELWLQPVRSGAISSRPCQ